MRFQNLLIRALNLASIQSSLLDKLIVFLSTVTRPFWSKLRSDQNGSNTQVWECKINDVHFFLYFPNNHETLLTIEEILAKEEYEFKLEDPSVIIDLGGNIGLSTIFFAIKYPSARILCFEPSPAVQVFLQKNTEQFDNIELFKVAISECDDVVTFYENTQKSIASSLKDRQDGAVAHQVQSWSFETILARCGIDAVDLVKFDIEGAEYAAFAACRQRNKLRHVIGEIHEDLMSAGIDDFAALFPHIVLHSEPANKAGRYIVKG